MLDRGARIACRANTERGIYLVSGTVEVEDRAVAPTQMAVFSADADAAVQAPAPSVLMLLGGAPVGKRFIDWSFVSSSRERIAQQKPIGARAG
jgi:redox-sensitive bicupin YhaK (pirin superfamily)